MEDRVFITGAAGALGGALMRHFGARAVGIARRPPAGPGQWIASALPEAGWIDETPGATVVHAAGLSAALAGGDAAALAAPHMAFVRALAGRGWRGRLVLLSSAAVYGEPARLPVPESAPTVPLTAYGRHKLLVEQGLTDLAASHGFGLAILRLANVYGTPLDLARRRVAALILDALARGAPFTVFGDGASQRDYLHADDFAEAVAQAVGADPPALLNLGSGLGTSLAELIATAESVTGRRLELRREPARAEAASSVLDISAIRAALGWQPRVSLAEGVANLSRTLASG